MTRFAFSPIGIQFAFADCIAALEENLWEEAVKLFLIHTHEYTPTITNRIADAPLRYHLDLYDCPRCGQRCAEVITDDKDGERWVSRPDYVRAHQTSNPEHRPTALSRAMTTIRTIGQAVKAGLSRTAFPSAVFLGLLAIAIFFAVGWVLARVMAIGPWDRPIPHPHVP